MRLFAAVYPPPSAREHLAALVRRLAVGQPAAPGSSLRLVPPEQWHLTLVFLGELADERCGAAAEAVARGVSSIAAPTLRIAGGGRFGRGASTVLWAGVDGDVAGFGALAGAVRTQLRRARLPHDRKPQRPHLTLARPGDRLPGEATGADLCRLGEYTGPWWPVEAVRLVRSQLGPRPGHTTIGSWEPGGPAVPPAKDPGVVEDP
ncbi:MAG: RNA 2',3'-cyclic phosphodiesterase [Dactylosporangium sp.]|nr:RNA 2',3'-cyclic phosphodiesterase [Dactylosporangium sp.]NNJ62077.1 RNA 2',3'-cyclic phosphodiesterase [Dactylosporangium sp.]